MINNHKAAGQSVGLVLSGGGPKGAAHIGALRALEENNIPVDFIAGTSMGAIIGALYAGGYSPAEIEHIISSDEMKKWIGRDMDKEYSFFFKQPGPSASWQSFDVKTDSIFKIKLPANIIAPHEMDYVFMQLFSGPGAAACYNFDSLMIPFRCVVADVAESKAVVMKSGDLGRAVRASATFPFYFKPVKIDGKLMFDGGMYDNFPVDIMENTFHPGYIIGIKAASAYGPPEENDLLSQIQSMLMKNTRDTIDEDKGIIIRPLMKSTSIIDFSNTKEFIDSGYVYTLKSIPQIRKYVKRSVDSTERYNRRQNFSKKIPGFKVGNLIINGVNDKQRVYIEKLLNIKSLKKNLNNKNDSLLLKELKKKYRMLIADENIEYVYPVMRYNEQSGKYDIILDITKASKVKFDLGGLISSQATNEIYFELQYHYWAKKSLTLCGNAYLGRFHNSGHLEINYGFPGTQPVAVSAGYTYGGWNYFNTNTYFFEDEKPNYIVEGNNFGRFSVFTPAGQHGKFGIAFETGGAKYKYYQTNRFSRTDTADMTGFNFYSPEITFQYNTLNRLQFPSSGSAFSISARLVGGEEHTIPGSTVADTAEEFDYHKWLQLKIHYDNYFMNTKRLSLGLFVEALVSNHDLFRNYTASLLVAPVFQPLPQMKTYFQPQYIAYSYGGAGLKAVFHPLRNFDLRIEGYAFQPYQRILKDDYGDAYFSPVLSNISYISSGNLVYHAPFGPVSMSFNYYYNEENPFVFNINIGYLIFNRKPLE